MKRSGISDVVIAARGRKQLSSIAFLCSRPIHGKPIRIVGSTNSARFDARPFVLILAMSPDGRRCGMIPGALICRAIHAGGLRYHGMAPIQHAQEKPAAMFNA